jgi:hypothetical protein
MSSKAKPDSKTRKKKDPSRRRKIVYGIIAIVIVLAMIIAIFEALFLKDARSTPPPETSISSMLSI